MTDLDYGCEGNQVAIVSDGEFIEVSPSGDCGEVWMTREAAEDLRDKLAAVLVRVCYGPEA